jgi:hypothetical protein
MHLYEENIVNPNKKALLKVLAFVVAMVLIAWQNNKYIVTSVSWQGKTYSKVLRNSMTQILWSHGH